MQPRICPYLKHNTKAKVIIILGKPGIILVKCRARVKAHVVWKALRDHHDRERNGSLIKSLSEASNIIAKFFKLEFLHREM